jgi:hypothetical protein
LQRKSKSKQRQSRAIAVDFADFAKKVNAPEATIENMLSKADANLAKFQKTAADTSIPTDRLIKRLENLSKCHHGLFELCTTDGTSTDSKRLRLDMMPSHHLSANPSGVL